MVELNLARWSKVWLARGLPIQPVPGSAMIDIHGVKGFLTPGDVIFLFNLAASVPAGGNYLEIGSWLGLSSLIVANGLLANVNLDARAWCVDTWEGSAEHQGLDVVKHGGLYDAFRHNVEEAQMDHFIRPVRGQSAEIARRWPGPALDVVFVDGDHSAAGCYADIRAWRPRLAPGGRMLGHDATPGGGVRAALEQYAAETGVGFRLHEPPAAHYIWEMTARDHVSLTQSRRGAESPGSVRI